MNGHIQVSQKGHSVSKGLWHLARSYLMHHSILVVVTAIVFVGVVILIVTLTTYEHTTTI